MCVVDFKKLSDKYVELTDNDGKGTYWWVQEHTDLDEEVVDGQLHLLPIEVLPTELGVLSS
ncbi:MAG: hypothetical protein U0Y10_02820 [Spirosomataceae bacterium]